MVEGDNKNEDINISVDLRWVVCEVKWIESIKC